MASDRCESVYRLQFIWQDINFVARVSPREGWIDFLVFKVNGWSGTAPSFDKRSAGAGYDPTSDWKEAIVFLDGSIKWDGCMNFCFPDQEHVMLHVCGRREAKDLGVLMDRLYDVAAQCMPEHAQEWLS
jgi:hypothetical protein